MTGPKYGLALVQAGLAAAGCAPLPPHSKDVDQVRTDVALSGVTFIDEGETGSMRADFARLLRGQLAEGGVEVRPDAPVAIDFGLSLHEAEVGIGGGGYEQWISEPRKSYILDACEVQRMRATITFLDRATGTVLSRAATEENVCGPVEPALQRAVNEILPRGLVRANAPD